MIYIIAFHVTALLFTLWIFHVPVMNSVYGDSDYILELGNLNKKPVVSNFEIDGEAYLQICSYEKLYNNCEIRVTNSSFSQNTANLMINHSLDFDVIYDIEGVNENSKKINIEKFSESMTGCKVYDIIEDKTQKIYFCDNGMDFIKRNSDSKMWYYESIGIYDTLKNTYVVKGDFEYSPP